MSTSENSKKVYPLHNDLMFKHIFGIKENIKFTRYLLDKLGICEKNMLNNIKIINSAKLTTENYNDKKFEVDILIELPNKDVVNLEMYNNPSISSDIKSEMYACRLYGKQLKAGNKYQTAKKVKQYNFMKNGSLKRENELALSGVRYESGDIRTKGDYLQIYDIKIDGSKKEMKKEVKNLLEFMNAETKEEMQEIAKKDEVLEDMFKEMEIYSEDEDFTRACYDREGYIMAVARDHGLEDGIKIGRKEGKKEGKKEGVIQGQKNERKSIIKKMLESNVSPEDIAKYTNLTIEEIKSLKGDK